MYMKPKSCFHTRYFHTFLTIAIIKNYYLNKTFLLFAATTIIISYSNIIFYKLWQMCYKTIKKNKLSMVGLTAERKHNIFAKNKLDKEYCIILSNI